MSAVATISQSALSHNLSVVKKHAPQAKIVAMVKANAYGHHIDLVAPLLKGADILAVSGLQEARALKKISNKPILLLSGVYSDEELRQAIALDCQCVIHHPAQIALIKSSTQATKVWLKIDSGMHRLGFSADQYQQCYSDFRANSLINIKCVMSHFACADNRSHPMNQAQLELFNALTEDEDSRSMANSAAILSLPESHFDIVRPGIMLYGASPFSDNNFTLKPVMQLSAPVISVKALQTGEFVGYGATWVADKPTTIATIAIGYGDGYPRNAKNGTPVLINGALCPLAGYVSMDMLSVDVGNIEVAIGDKAILWGDEKLRVETVAHHSNTISYELLTSVSSRVNFVSGQ